MQDPEALDPVGKGGPPPRRWTPGPALAGVLSLMVFASLLLLPLFGIVTAVLAPLPLVHLASGGRPTVLGWGWVAICLAGAALLTQAAWLVAALVGYLAVAVWPPVTVEIWARRRWSSGRWLALVALGVLALGFAVGVAAAYPAHPADRLAEAMTAAAGGTEAMLRHFTPSGRFSPELLREALGAAAFLMPAVAALYVLAVGMWLRPRLGVLGFEVGREPFHLVRAEEWLPVGFALGGLGWVFTAGIPKWLAGNLLVVVLGLYFVAGLAIIHFYLGRRLGSNRWIRLAVALFALQVPVALAVTVAGLIDGFFPLRRGAGWDGGSER